jgi:1,4-dihydroxy-2-naphthoyl-CoA hydrolase
VSPQAFAELTRHEGLAGFLDVEFVREEAGLVEARLELRDELLLAPGNFLHGGTVVAFADSLAGWGTLASLPDGSGGFATSELSVNLVATTSTPDALHGVARLLHGGRRTQVWDVTISRESDGRDIAYFRCTQQLLAAQR